MRAAVVGGGIFGCTAAVELARAGYEVDLFERHHNVMLAASRACQGRLHAGYHYPRSVSTAREVRDAGPEFAARFPAAVVRSNRHHYVVAKGSPTGAEKYLAVLDELQLPYRQVEHPLVRSDSTELTLVAEAESFVDLAELRVILRAELLGAGVDLRLHAEVDPSGLVRGYDLVVDATYGRASKRSLRFELCEIALVRLGRQFAGLSFVVMDGPYNSLDPLAGTDLHMLYDVDRSVHHVSDAHEVPPAYVNHVDQGPKHAPMTRVDGMLAGVRRFLNGVGMPEYRGSLFTVRAVLPDVDDTDARPTILERDGNLVTVLSGKIGTAVSAARQVVALAGEVRR